MSHLTADCDETHDPHIESFLALPGNPELFPIQNLPLGVCAAAHDPSRRFVGTLVDGQVVDLSSAVGRGLLDAPFDDGSLARYMGLSADARRQIRRQLFALLRRGSPAEQQLREAVLPLVAVSSVLPVTIGDYTDFYASIDHAQKVGSLFRPDEPLLPNYKHLPIAYHGRSSSIVAGDTIVRRPTGQRKGAPTAPPELGPTAQLDYELELGAFIGPGNLLGEPIPIGKAREQLVGFVLLNDWSARDIQSWEYQPLGPFLGKNFLTSISPWIVTAEALAPFTTEVEVRSEEDPKLLPYLDDGGRAVRNRFDIELEVLFRSRAMKEIGTEPVRLSRGNSRSLYWSFEQMVAHHTVNGCNLRAGDLLGSGTISGPTSGERGCLLELTERGKTPLALPDGTTRSFLELGDEIVLRGVAKRDGFRAIGFGELRGQIG